MGEPPHIPGSFPHLVAGLFGRVPLSTVASIRFARRRRSPNENPALTSPPPDVRAAALTGLADLRARAASKEPAAVRETVLVRRATRRHVEMLRSRRSEGLKPGYVRFGATNANIKRWAGVR